MDVPRASGTAPKTFATPFASPNALRSACGSNFGRFSVNARKLRSVFRIGFYNVFSMSDISRLNCSSHAKILKKNNRLGLENRDSERPGEAWRSKFERKNGQVDRKSALEVPSGPPKNFQSARTKALRASKSACERPRRARNPKAPGRFSVISRWIFRDFGSILGSPRPSKN